MGRPRKQKKGPSIELVGMRYDPVESAAEHMAEQATREHPIVKRLKESTKKALLRTAKQVQKTRKRKPLIGGRGLGGGLPMA